MNIKMKFSAGRILSSSLFLLAAACPGMAAVIVDKTPDLGAYWSPLNATGGTYVYGSSFVSGVSAQVDTLGLYMLNSSGGVDPSQFRIQLWGDIGDSPDPGNVLATTGILTNPDTFLQLISANVVTPVSILSGTRYWIVGTTVGLAGTDDYQLGGHTQNSIYADNGTFWFSNDPDGVSFDGQNLTPEIAIYAAGSESAVPEPGSLLLLGSGLAVIAFRRSLRFSR